MHSHVPLPTAEQFRTIPIIALEFPDEYMRSLHPQVDVALCDQVQKFGLLQPLPVQQTAEHAYHLLAGYPYLPVLHHLGYKQVVCQIVSGIPAFSRYALQILHSLSTIRTSPILQAHLLKTAEQTLAGPEVVQLLPLMGHKPQRYKIQELLALLDLAPESTLALHQGLLAPKTGKLLARLSVEDQNFLISLVEQYRPGGSKQQKLIEMLIELSLRHNRPMSVFLKPWTEARPEEDRTNLPQQLQGLLRYLQEQSFPHLTEAEIQFHQASQAFSFPAHVQLHHSPSFEDESVELRIHCEDLASLDRLWQALSPLIADSRQD